MRTRQWIQAVLSLCMGLYLLDTLLSGRIAFYINIERFVWLSWVAAFILIAMGAAQVYELIRRSANATQGRVRPAPTPLGAPLIDSLAYDATSGTSHDHAGHGQVVGGRGPSWLVLAAIAIPLVMGLAIPAKPLSAGAIQTSGVSAGFSASKTDVLSIAAADRNVLDWIRAFNTSTNYSEFNGQQADVIGFVYRDIRMDQGKQFMVARFAVACCVADASAIGVLVQTADAAKWPQDTWVRVKGKFDAQTIGDQKSPVLVAESVEAIAEPKQPYLYP